jgi:hypothetical protein
MKFNISFKRGKEETGLAAIGHPFAGVDIKLNKKIIGRISPPHWNKEGWSILLSVKEEESNNASNCNWKNIFFKKRFNTEEDARQWVKDNLKSISEDYEFHYQED